MQSIWYFTFIKDWSIIKPSKESPKQKGGNRNEETERVAGCLLSAVRLNIHIQKIWKGDKDKEKAECMAGRLLPSVRITRIPGKYQKGQTEYGRR